MLAENLAQDIREQEALAKSIIADAKEEAAKITAAAQVDAEQSIKSTKQQCHRQWRESLANAEIEADAKAKDILQNGQNAAKLFYENKKKSAEEVANWLVKEVTATYGSC